MKNKHPLVLLAGRTNVGKSALFNRLVGGKKSLVLDRDGVTRDWIEESVTWGKKKFLLADIGGLETGGVMEALIKEAFELKVQQAAVVVMVGDIITGVTQKDLEVAKLLKTYGKTTILALNKADDATKDLDVFAFYRLGLGSEPIAISALHARGIADLLERICQALPAQDPDEIFQEAEPVCKISIIGKPNAGKSSLLNRILQRPRAIVDDVPGTTREPIIERFYIDNMPFQLADTAGVRRQRSVDDELETMMVKTSMDAIRKSDLVVLMIDASLGELSSQDLKLLSYAVEQEKALILALNKTDLLQGDDYVLQCLETDLDKYDFLTKKFPVVRMSCKENKNVFKLQKLIVEIWKRCQKKFDSNAVGELLTEQMIRRPLYKDGHVLKVWRVKAFSGQVPTFHLKVNLPKFFDDSHLRYIENILRANLDLFGCPIRISYS